MFCTFFTSLHPICVIFQALIKYHIYIIVPIASIFFFGSTTSKVSISLYSLLAYRIDDPAMAESSTDTFRDPKSKKKLRLSQNSYMVLKLRNHSFRLAREDRWPLR